MELKDTWPEIIESQKLGQYYYRENRRRGNLRNRF